MHVYACEFLDNLLLSDSKFQFELQKDVERETNKNIF